MAKLPSVLEESCVEGEEIGYDNRGYNVVENAHCLSFERYFKDHELIYNKMKMYTHLGFELSELTSRFKPICYLVDYHEKDFKELKAQ
jgi:hypothetical protein